MAEYTVGYGKPPEKGKFKKGRSGNPKGRPKGTRNFQTDLLEELSERIVIQEGKRPVKVTKQRALIKRMMNSALNGDLKSAAFVVSHLVSAEGAEALREEDTNISENDRKIINEFFKQNKKPEKPRAK